MTEYAYRSQSTRIRIAPGDERTYRLPTMMPGTFHLSAAPVVLQAPLPLINRETTHGSVGVSTHDAVPLGPASPAIAVGGGVVIAGTGTMNPGPSAPGGGPPGTPIPRAEDLVMELLHGDQLVATAVNGFPVQSTPSEGDDTWRVRIRLGPGSPPNEDGDFVITLSMFPTVLPLLTRRIPLAFFQQGFDSNWNGRNYVGFAVEDSHLIVRFDPELASYYNLSNVDRAIVTPVSGLPVPFPSIQMLDSHLSIDTSDGSFDGLPGPLTYIHLAVTLSGFGVQVDGADIFKVHDFTINVKFFLTRDANQVGYRCQVASDFESKVYDTNGVIQKRASDGVTSALAKLQTFLDSHSLQVGAILTPWLLGAAFDVENVTYSPTNSQPIPATSQQGDIVIQYVGRPADGDAGPGMVIVHPPAVLTVTTTDVADGIVGQPYSQDFAAEAGVSPLSWSVVGLLPAGTTFADGRLSGTPMATGVYHIEVVVRDASNAQASRAYAFAVNAPNLSISTHNPLPDAVSGEPYAVALTAPVAASAVWSATGLPPGLSISPRGVVSGTPSASGSVSTVAVEVVETKGRPAYKALALTVHDALLFNDPLYSPRGDGDAVWRPPKAASSIAGLPTALGHATTPGDLAKVDHIVVVMMENRSFDHMLGYLSREGGRTDVEGLKWETGDDRTQFNFYKGRYYYPHLLTATQAFHTEAMGPDHSHESVKAQMADGMKHFVSDYAKNKVGDDPELLHLVMGYYSATQLPVYDMFAREYAICDHWFCSHPGPTWPNRFVTLTGDLNRDSYGEPEVNTPLYTDFTPTEATTIFDLLTSAGVSWQYFQQRASIIRAFTKYSFDMTHVLEYDAFPAAVRSGLASVTFIDPLFGDLPAGVNSPPDNDDAPPADLKDGQRFVSEVYRTLFNPEINKAWSKTMLVIVYDEHGGFYDHVDPPTNATPLIGQNSGKLGPRVPAFVISPWTPAGLVLKETFDHGTIGATILRRFCSPHPPVLSPRVTAALDLRQALPLARPRGGTSPVLGVGDVVTTGGMKRTVDRRFKVPRAPDAFGALLGGISMTLGATPR